jgi:5-methylcytosine-specific restriction endonuclease McrA
MARHRPDDLHATCNTCHIEQPTTAFNQANNYRWNTCRACVNRARKARYHQDPQYRAKLLFQVVTSRVTKKFPNAMTDLTQEQYVNMLLEIEACTYCQHPNDGSLVFSLDHAVPLARGGRHALDNLVPCCEPCNMAKGARSAEEFRAWLLGVAQRLAS